MPAFFQIGDYVTFDYSLGEEVHDKYPKILCLHNHWRGCVHGLNFNYLTQQEINYVKAVINPEFAKEIIKTDRSIAGQLLRLQLLGKLNITSPYDFYIRFVRGFIKPKQWDPYRRYNVNKIRGPRIITRKSLMVGTLKSTFNDYIDKLQHFNGPRFGEDQPTQDYAAPSVASASPAKKPQNISKNTTSKKSRTARKNRQRKK